jgi:hypothetical protein
MCKNTSIINFLLVPVICLSFAFVLSASPGKADTDLPPSEGDIQLGTQLQKTKATLHKKSSEMVKTYANDRYAIDRTTLVVGEDGRQLLIQHLMVPCEAELLYETRADGSNFVHRIKVLSTHQRASNRMEDLPR